MCAPPPDVPPTGARERGGSLPVFAARPCPYSHETVTGCPFYEPVSEHGSAPDAAACRYVLRAEAGRHVRTLVCVRAAGVNR